MYKTSHEKKKKKKKRQQLREGRLKSFWPLGLCVRHRYSSASAAAATLRAEIECCQKPQRPKPKTRGVRSCTCFLYLASHPLAHFGLIGRLGGWKGANNRGTDGGYSGDEVKDRTNIGPTLVSPEGHARTECH
jgi:hypothetical protein